MSTLDKLNKLNAKLETKEKKKEPERPEMPVPPSVLTSFMRLVPAQQIAKIAEERVALENSMVSEEMLAVYAGILWDCGSRPTNPRLKVSQTGKPNMNGLYQVQERFKLVYEKGEAPVRDRMVAALCKAGFSVDSASKIVEGEINYQPMTVLRPLNELAVGSAVEKSAAEKIINLVFGEAAEPLTDEERAVSVQKIEVVSVKDGILERIKQYCNSVQQLVMLFKVIRPTNFVSHVKVEGLTPEQEVDWLVESARELIKGKK